MDIFEFILIFAGNIVFIIAPLCFVVWQFLRNRRIKREGIEAEASVIRCDESVSSDGDGGTVTDYTCYVKYKDQNGNIVVALLVNPCHGLAAGSRIKIKYEPEKPRTALLTKVIK